MHHFKSMAESSGVFQAFNYLKRGDVRNNWPVGQVNLQKFTDFFSYAAYAPDRGLISFNDFLPNVI